MPTYIYLCGECGNRIEQYKSMKDRNEIVECLACKNKVKMDRLIGTGCGFKITGSGVFKQGWTH